MRADAEIVPDDTAALGGLIGFGLSLGAVTLALAPIIWPPFTDAELENFVDTWEPAVFVGFLMLPVFAVGALMTGIAAWFCDSLSRKLFGAASLAFIVAVALQITSLNILTAQAEKASGHVLHWAP